jgi:hypothetical protein
MKTGDKIIAIINDVHITKGKEYTIEASDKSLYRLRNDVGLVVFFEQRNFIDIFKFSESNIKINTPSHYDNSKGTLYKVAQERGWNPYLFDIVKRLERAEKKGEFESDLDKSIAVIQLWKNEQTTKN